MMFSPLGSILGWLEVAAEVAMVVSGLWLALRPRTNRFVRFAPLATLGAWLVTGLVHLLVEGISSVLVIPIGCFGIFAGVRLLSHRSRLENVFSICSLIFWPFLIFVACRYLILVHAAS